MPRMLDLCSGLGGASQAFLEAGWDVTRIENNPLLATPSGGYYVQNTHNIDVFDFDYIRNPIETIEIFNKKYDFVWASPTCTGFSNAYAAPMPTDRRNNEKYQPDMSLVLKCHEIIQRINPKNWVIENVSGSSKYISKSLGMPPWQIIGPFFLWGRFPFVSVNRDLDHRKGDNCRHSEDPLKSVIKAKIPIEISRAFLDALTNQKTLVDFYE